MEQRAPHSPTNARRCLNDLFQTANTGAVAEYAQIEETIAPEALQAMGDWLTERLRPGRRRRN